MLGKAFLEDQTGGRDMSMPQLANCPHCHARNQGGKFCVDCGKQIVVDVICKNCDTVWPSVTTFKFCPNCGAGITEYADAGTLKSPAEEAAAEAQSLEKQAQRTEKQTQPARSNASDAAQPSVKKAKPAADKTVPIKKNKPKIAASQIKTPKKKPAAKSNAPSKKPKPASSTQKPAKSKKNAKPKPRSK